MSIWKTCHSYLRERRQKGQIIVCTAVLLPFIIAMCGLTVDFGNMYVHKSRLQNAADAAAIAGAYAYADNNESTTTYPKAKAASQKSLDANLPDTTLASGKCKPIESTDGKIYYGVKISENVPIYFLRLFNVGDTAEVAADAYAAISSTGGGGGIFKNLFSFSGYQNPWYAPDHYGFKSINANQNPDNTWVSNIGNSSIYEGDIVGIGNDADLSQNYTHVLLTKKAKEEYDKGNITYVQEAIDKQNGTITNKNDRTQIDGYQDKDPGYYAEIKSDTSTTLDSELARIVNAAKNNHLNTNTYWDNGKYLSNIISDSSNSTDANKQNYAYYDGNNNARLYVDTNLSQGDDPFYVVIDNPYTVFLNITNQKVDKTSRPLIYVYTGTGTINIEAQNAFFHGIIYAPNACVHINDNGLKFYGCVAAKAIELTGKAYYEIDTKLASSVGGGSSSGSNSGSGASSGSSSIGLASPPSNINWD